MESKHTPGPWAAHYDDNGFYYVVAEEMPRPYIVATANEGDIDKGNANLIAGAPDMLKALEAVYKDIELNNVNGGSDELNIMVQNAIKKATDEKA